MQRTMKPVYLFSHRFSVARGWHWKVEREVTRETMEQWRQVYEQDEPGVPFYAGVRHPNDAAKV